MDGNTIVVLLVALGGVAVGIIVYALIRKKAAADKLGRAKAKVDQILDEARGAAENTLKAAQVEAKEVILQAKADFEAEAKEARREIKQLEARLLQKEENLDRKAEQLDKKEGDVAGREKGLVKREQKISAQEEQAQQLVEAQTQELERIAGLTAEQAKDTLVQAMESEARHEGAKLIKRIEMETNEIADKKARKSSPRQFKDTPATMWPKRRFPSWISPPRK